MWDDEGYEYADEEGWEIDEADSLIEFLLGQDGWDNPLDFEGDFEEGWDEDEG